MSEDDGDPSSAVSDKVVCSSLRTVSLAISSRDFEGSGTSLVRDEVCEGKET